MSDLENFGIHSFEVSGIMYEQTLIPASISLDIFTSLIKIFGEPLSVLISTVVPDLVQSEDGKDKLSSVMSKVKDEEFVTRVVRKLISNLDNKEVLRITRLLLANVKESHKPTQKITLETHFRGKLMTLFKVLGHVIQQNYSDFLGDAGELRAFASEVTRGADSTQAPLQ